MAQCTDTHLFCTSCVTSYASARLGEQNSDLHCIDISGCKMPFHDSELRRVLPGKLFKLYEHIRQCREIELAGLEGLEECPFCDFKVVIDVDFQADKVLRCQNEDCGKVSCRKCKNEVSICTSLVIQNCLLLVRRITFRNLVKVNMISCVFPPAALTLATNSEAEEDKKLDGKHAIEEAMSMLSFGSSDVLTHPNILARALMRNCPKCQKGARYLTFSAMVVLTSSVKHLSRNTV